MPNKFLTFDNGGHRLSKAISQRIDAATSGNQIICTNSQGYLDSSLLPSAKDIVYSTAEPAQNANNLWWELDGSGTPLYTFFWCWDSAFNAWRSPLREVFFNYRNDVDASIATGYFRHYVKHLDWWIYPVDGASPNQANLICMRDQSVVQSVSIPLTSLGDYSGGRVSNANLDFSTSAFLIETRFARDNYNSGVVVYGGIRAYYYFFR